jgi:predicted PurR-regulated permease PerM
MPAFSPVQATPQGWFALRRAAGSLTGSVGGVNDHEPAVPRHRAPREPHVTYVAFPPRILRNSALIVLLLFVVLQISEWLVSRLGNFLILLLLSFLVAIAMEPAINWMTGRGVRRGIAAGVALLGVVLTTVAFLVAFGGVLFAQVAGLARGLPALTREVVAWINTTFGAEVDPSDIMSRINPDAITEALGGFAGGIVGVINLVVAGFISILTMLFFSYYIAAEGPALRRAIGSWLPDRQQRVFVNVWAITVEKTGGFVVSKLILAAVSAVAHAALYWAIGVPYWLPMALFTGVVSQFIPTIGTYIGVALPILFVVFDNWFDAILIIIFATLYQQIENLLLTPRISRRTMNVHPAIALGSVFVGAAALGPVGAVIAIPIAAAIVAVLDTYGNRYALIPELADDSVGDDDSLPDESSAGAPAAP